MTITPVSVLCPVDVRARRPLAVAAAAAALAAAKAAKQWEVGGCAHISCTRAREAARAGGRFYSPEKGGWVCFGCRLPLKHARWALRRAARAMRATQE